MNNMILTQIPVYVRLSYTSEFHVNINSV